MDSRQRVLTAMRRQTPDRVPVDLSWGLTPALLVRFKAITGADNPDDYFGLDVRFVSAELAKGWGSTPGIDDERNIDPDWQAKEGELRAWLDDDDPAPSITEWGIGHRRGSELHFIRFVHPLRKATTPQEIEYYPLPTFAEPWRWVRLDRTCKEYHTRGLCVGGNCASTIFETAWQLRGMERLLVDMLQQPEMAAILLDRVTAIRCVLVERLVHLGVDVLILGDDVAQQHGMLLSPGMWRSWLRPRLAQVIQAARHVRPDILIFYHSDGNLLPIIPDLIEIGVDILNPVQPECMDPAFLKQRFGDQLAFWGTLGTQTTLPFGTPQEVQDEVRWRIETVGPGGGLLLGPTHALEPDVPWENILAFFEAVQRYGNY
jgi:uroporphyrinogen decarboxylase